jgi:hypothetical protein
VLECSLGCAIEDEVAAGTTPLLWTAIAVSDANHCRYYYLYLQCTLVGALCWNVALDEHNRRRSRCWNAGTTPLLWTAIAVSDAYHCRYYYLYLQCTLVGALCWNVALDEHNRRRSRCWNDAIAVDCYCCVRCLSLQILLSIPAMHFGWSSVLECSLG